MRGVGSAAPQKTGARRFASSAARTAGRADWIVTLLREDGARLRGAAARRRAERVEVVFTSARRPGDGWDDGALTRMLGGRVCVERIGSAGIREDGRVGIIPHMQPPARHTNCTASCDTDSSPTSEWSEPGGAPAGSARAGSAAGRAVGAVGAIAGVTRRQRDAAVLQPHHLGV